MAEYPKQIVPPFSKKDVENIVNDGIKNGDIELPESGGGSGGTQLYLHEVDFQYLSGGDPFRGTLFIISYDNTELTSIPKLASFIGSSDNLANCSLSKRKVIKIWGSDFGSESFIFSLDYDSFEPGVYDYAKLYAWKVDGTKINCDLDTTFQIADTVTEL